MIDDNETFSGATQELSFKSVGEHKVCLSVTDSNGLTDRQCTNITVQKHIAPTLMMVMKDEQNQVITKDMNLTRSAKYDFSCAGSVDDCGNDIAQTCKWNAHSYKIVDGKKEDYIKNCISHNHAPENGSESWVKLCGAKSNKFTYVEITLEATDMFNNTTSQVYVYGVNP